MINKTIQRSEDCFVQFTNEELTKLGIKEGDKFSWEEDNGSFIMKKHIPVEIDMSDWSRDVLEMLICESVEKDISVNDVICGIIEKAL